MKSQEEEERRAKSAGAWERDILGKGEQATQANWVPRSRLLVIVGLRAPISVLVPLSLSPIAVRGRPITVSFHEQCHSALPLPQHSSAGTLSLTTSHIDFICSLSL